MDELTNVVGAVDETIKSVVVVDRDEYTKRVHDSVVVGIIKKFALRKGALEDSYLCIDADLIRALLDIEEVDNEPAEG